MNDSPQIVGKGAFMIKSWEDYRKGGGIAPSPQEVARYLKGGNGARLSREELISRVSQFFSDFTTQCMDEDTGEITFTWKSCPTKASLARYIGVTAETLSRYLRGERNGSPYNAETPGGRAVVAASDFDVIKGAVNIIEEFYEGRLGVNMNGAGSIFWLKCHDDSRWHDKQELNLSASAGQSVPQMSREEIAARYRAQEEFREKPQLPEGID